MTAKDKTLSDITTIPKDDDNTTRNAWESLKAIKSSRKGPSNIPEDYRVGRNEYLDERYNN